MDIDELIANCPPFTLVRFLEAVNSPRLFVFASPGDVLELAEVGDKGPTGNRITALVIACEVRGQSDIRAVRPRADVPEPE